MFLQLALSTLMVLVTVIIHGGGLAVLGRTLGLELREEITHHVPPLSARSLVTLVLVLALLFLHSAEIWLYAVLYLALGAVGMRAK